MMNKKQRVVLWAAFKDFYLFSPAQQSIILALMLTQGITAGVGLLFIIPLLQLVGFDMGGTGGAGITSAANQVFEVLAVEVNLVNVLMSYIFIVTLIASLRYQLTVMTTKVQQAYISTLRDKLYRGLLHSRWQFIVEHKMSDFTHCLSGQVQSIGHASNLMLSFLSQLVLTLVMIAIVLLLSWEMSLLAIGFAAVLLVLLQPFNRFIYGSGKGQLLSFKSLFQMLSEQLGSLKMIKSYASEDYYAQQMQQVSNALESQQLKFTRMNAMTQWVYMVGAVIAFSLFFYVAQSVLVLPLATILLLLVIFSRLLPKISGLQKTYQQLLHKGPAFNDVSDMLQTCEQAKEPLNPNQTCPVLHQCIRIQAISYQYPKKDQPVFEDLSLTIEKNQTLALVGPSGAGKSTLADLIAGLLEPENGTIYCDEVPLDGEQRLAWRQRVAYVTQEVYLFHDTIRANLSWVSSIPVDDDDLWRALKLAAADDFVAQLPQGLDTVIGDRGIRLSGGERQRIALARALLAEPQLLILDEATSALDHENEQKIQQALEQLQGKLTIVIIAHRETTIAHADKRIELGDMPRHSIGVDGCVDKELELSEKF
jgi:ATP-binding cassette, subfamily C, bacterial